MQEWIKENGKIPVRDDFNSPSYVTYEREFGSWTDAIKIITGFESNDNSTRSRKAEIQTLSEFKTEGAVDLSGQNRNNTCDGMCPKGELFDTKSASLTKLHGYWGWAFNITMGQLEEAEYLFLRAYKDKDFTKEPEHKWRVPVKFMDNRRSIFIHKDNRGMYNVDNMKKYEMRI